MFDDAANALEEIEPEDKTRNEVLYARVDIYLAAKKWHMAAAVASHLIKNTVEAVRRKGDQGYNPGEDHVSKRETPLGRWFPVTFYCGLFVG